MNSVSFTVKNGAYDPEAVNAKIVEILVQHIAEEMGSIESAVYALDASHFYLPSGAKILKPIRGILSRVLSKAATDSVMQAVSGSIAALYSPAYELDAGFDDISSIGQYGDSGSCFLEGECNSINRVFLKKNHRVKLLVLRKTTDADACARCFVYFPGGREIRLFNFYYAGITQNSRLFTEAARRLMGAKKVKVTEIERGDVNLPVYINSGAVKVSFDRAFIYSAPRVFVCPHCDNAMPEADIRTEINNNSYLIGCCYDCLKTGDYYACCSRCEGGVDEDHALTNNSGDVYCEECYDAEYTHCQNSRCEVEVYIQDIYSDGLCEECYFDKYTVCERCGSDVEKEDAVTVDGVDYHDTCADREFYICRDCGDYIPSGDEEEVNGKWYCPGCKSEQDVAA